MASACVNNNVRLLSETFFDTPTDWFNPRSSSDKPSSPAKQPEKDILDLDFSGDGSGDFEFHLDDDPVKMLPADELFSDGKLMPSLHLSSVRTSVTNVENVPISSSSSSSSASVVAASVEEILKSKISSLSGMDPYLFSPKAPRCSSGWRELLGLKKLQNAAKQDTKTSLKSTNSSTSSSSLKHFMHRNPKFDPSLGTPLLKQQTDSEPESVSAKSSSTNSRTEVPRVSLDSISNNKSSANTTKRNPHHPPRVRLVRRVPDSNSNNNNTNHHHHQMPATPSSNSVSASASALGVSIDSPRMNSSGKVVFQSLERSSSSPSTFNGGPRVKYKGMERRSYSANVKVSPVLNVPVCSLRGSSKFGLGQLFPSPHKKAGTTTSTVSSDSTTERSRNHHHKKPLP